MLTKDSHRITCCGTLQKHRNAELPQIPCGRGRVRKRSACSKGRGLLSGGWAAVVGLGAGGLRCCSPRLVAEELKEQ